MSAVSTSVEGKVATVRFDRGGKANALNSELIAGLESAASAVGQRVDVDAVVLTGAAAIFAAGVDLKDEELWKTGAGDVERAQAMNAGGRMTDAWRQVPQAVIAAIEGPAIGGGAILALTADFRVMGSSSYLSFPEVRLGMTLGWGGLPLLVERLGSSRAKRVLFCDEKIGPEEALSLGLCDRIVDDGAAVTAAWAWAAELAEVPALALRMTKSAIDGHARQNWAGWSEADQFYLSRRLLEEAGRK
ncbi:enoyl-CoA hydratase/isomerase family protein [Falsigemmobacter intermedius]|uniref:Enoyl-CoA hydratase/isomerase family protein n=1 Tax=Falsigemmobacter intermedius TaxID=1553448 RepID=A0A444M8F2_9RHOB|nr:enoyl-CoA hydratase/isomerase family protein [Falsigemmobacter intermedius]RWY37659.1 enoyl-CoA hydratase/isomerase family protein [Falsigemmobacter intermedius]